MGDQYNCTAFAEWTRERNCKTLGCMHIDSCEWVVQENTLKSFSYIPTERAEIWLTDACEYNALANATLALWPPERVIPFSPISKPKLVSNRIYPSHIPDTYP